MLVADKVVTASAWALEKETAAAAAAAAAAPAAKQDLKEAGYSASELAEIGMTPQQIAKRKVFYRGTSCTKGDPTKRSFTTEAGGTLKTNFGVELFVPVGANISGEISVSLVPEDQKKRLMAPPTGVISVGPLIEVQPHAGRSSSFDKPVTMRLPHSSASPHCCKVLHCENIGTPWSEIDPSFCTDNSIEIRVNHFSFFTVVQAQGLPEQVRCRAYRGAFNGETNELMVQLWVVPDSVDKLDAHKQIMAADGFEECGGAEERIDTIDGAGFVALLNGSRQSQSWASQEARVLFEMSLPVTPEDAGKKLGWEAEIVRSWSTAVQRYSPEQISEFVVAIAAAAQYKIYAATFLNEGVAGSVFLELTDNKLKEDYEIEKKLHRERILEQIEEIKDDQVIKLPFAITIPTPELLPPPTAPEVTSRTQSECSLKWEGVAGATHYQIEVAKFSRRQLVGGKLPASAPQNTFEIAIKDCKPCDVSLHQALFAGFVRVRAVDSQGIGPASIATPLPPKEYNKRKLNQARRGSIALAESQSEPNLHRASHSQIDLLPIAESDTTGSHTAMEELDDVARQGQEDAAAARTMRRECGCLSDRLAALVLGLKCCATGKEPELATVLNHAQRASNLIRVHSDGGWLLLHITLADHALCFSSVDNNLLTTVNSVEHWSQASIAMRAASGCCYRPREKIHADFNRQKLLELLLKAFTTAGDLSEEAEVELCRGFRTDRTELAEEIEMLVAGCGVAALRHSCDAGGDLDVARRRWWCEQQYSFNTPTAEPSELGSRAELVNLLRSIQQEKQQLIQQASLSIEGGESGEGDKCEDEDGERPVESWSATTVSQSSVLDQVEPPALNSLHTPARSSWSSKVEHMEKLFLALEQEGESANAIALLKTLDSQQYEVSAAVGKITRDILIYLVGDVDIENEYFPPFVISYASDHREGDAEGQGPGVVRNYQVSTAFIERGQKLPMSGMLIREGNFVRSYLKCLNYKNMAITLGKPAAKVLVVLLSNALIRSAACLVEIHTALDNKIPLILLPLEDRIHWEATEGFSEPWPKEKCQPFLASYFPDWTLTTFALNKGTVLGHLQSENTYPPPGAVATEWAKDYGKDLLRRVVDAAVKKAGMR
jgi:hypothetical protein